MTQSFTSHIRSQIGTADTDINDIGQFFARITDKASQTYRFGKIFNFFQNLVYLRHYITSVNINRFVTAITQGNMQNRSVFGLINLFAAEHVFYFLGNSAFLSQIKQGSHNFVIDTIFGIINIHIIQLNRISFSSFGIFSKQIFHFRALKMFIFAFQFAPSFCIKLSEHYCLSSFSPAPIITKSGVMLKYFLAAAFTSSKVTASM